MKNKNKIFFFFFFFFFAKFEFKETMHYWEQLRPIFVQRKMGKNVVMDCKVRPYTPTRDVNDFYSIHLSDNISRWVKINVRFYVICITEDNSNLFFLIGCLSSEKKS